MNEIHDLAAPYLLGALESGEREAFERHLDGCPDCGAEIARLATGLDVLLDSVEEEAPPALKERILAQIGDSDPPVLLRPPRPRRWVAATAVAASVAVFASIYSLGMQSRLNELENLTRILASPDASRVTLTGIDGQVVVAGNRAILVATGLATLAEDRVYQLWLISDEGPVPAGTFRPDAEGNTVVLLDGEAAPGLVVGLTEEPAPGSTFPTGEVLATAEL